MAITRTASNTSVNELMGGGMIPVDSLPQASRSKIMKAVRAERKDMTTNMMNMTNALDKNTKLLPKLFDSHHKKMAEVMHPRRDTLINFFKTQEKERKEVSAFNRTAQGKYNKNLLDNVIQLHKFDTHDTKKFYKEMIEYQRYNSRFLRILSGRNGLIDRVFEGVLDMSRGAVTGLVGGAMVGLGKIFSGAVLHGPIKAAAIATKSFFSIFTLVPRLLAGAAPDEKIKPSMLLRGVRSLVHISSMVLLAGEAYRLFSGPRTDKDVADALKITGRKVDFIDKVAFFAGRVINDFTFGLADFFSDKLTGKSVGELLDTAGQTFSEAMKGVVTFVKAEFKSFKDDPKGYISNLPDRIMTAVGGAFDTAVTWVSDQIDKVTASGAIDFGKGMLSAILGHFTKPILDAVPTRDGTITSIKAASEWLAANGKILVDWLYDRTASIVHDIFAPDKKQGGETIAGALANGALLVLTTVGEALFDKLSATLTSKDFWEPIGGFAANLAKKAAVSLGDIAVTLLNAAVNVSFDYIHDLMAASTSAAILTGSSIGKASEVFTDIVYETITLTQGALDLLGKPFRAAADFLKSVQINITRFTGQSEFLIEGKKIEDIVTAAEETKGFFAPLIRIVNTAGQVFNGFAGVAETLVKFAEPLLSAVRIVGDVVAKFAIPIQVVLSVFDFMQGFTDAAKVLNIDPDKLTISDKIISGFSSVIDGIVGMPIHLVSWLVNKVANMFGYETGTLDNAGQLFGYENTAKMLSERFSKLGTLFTGVNDIVNSLVEVPWSLVKWGTKKVAELFGFDLFSNDPDASLEAAMNHVQSGKEGTSSAFKSYISLIFDIPFKMGVWVVNKVSKMMGFDIQLDNDIDKYLDKLQLPDIGGMIGKAVSGVISWVGNLFDTTRIINSVKATLKSIPGMEYVMGKLGFDLSPSAVTTGGITPGYSAGSGMMDSYAPAVVDTSSAFRPDMQFATGGIITSPISFQLNKNKTGVAGEAGPEAIMPLTKTADGSLGVMAKLELDSDTFKGFTQTVDKLAAMLSQFVQAIMQQGGQLFNGTIKPMALGAASAASNFYSNTVRPGLTSAANSVVSAGQNAITVGSNTVNHLDKSLPRGIRNNNPLNLTFLPGQGASGSDGRFGVYDSLEAGIAATYKQLILYKNRGLDSISKIINTWAPPSENDTRGYAQQVANSMGIGVNDTIDLTNPGIAASLISAMSKVENGARYVLNPQAVMAGISSAMSGVSSAAASVGSSAFSLGSQIANSPTGQAVGNIANGLFDSIKGATANVGNFLSGGVNDVTGLLGNLGVSNTRSPEAQRRYDEFQQQQQDSLASLNASLVKQGINPVGLDNFGFTYPTGNQDMRAAHDITSPVPNSPMPSPKKTRVTPNPAPQIQASNQSPMYSPMANIPFILPDIGLAIVSVEGLA